MLLIIVFLGLSFYASGVKHEKILLSDVQTLTLYKGQYTTGRRTSPVLQLKCLGGSASKSTYHPDVVQCYNRGSSDGRNFQWECKADLDNAVRFGKINVYCEGYDYADDPYILQGSCGLEYHLEHTSTGQKGNTGSYKSDENLHDFGTSLMGFIFFGAIIAFIYFTCIRRNEHDQPDGGQSRFRGGGPPPPPPYGGPPPPYDDRPSAPPPDNSSPPPYGFRPEHSQKQGASSYAGTSTGQGYRQTQAPQGAAAGGQGGTGFWTGMGAGGILGYLLGRNTGGSHRTGSMWYQPTYTQHRPVYTSRDDTSFFGSTNENSAAGSSGLGTRSASGFGETRRR